MTADPTTLTGSAGLPLPPDVPLEDLIWKQDSRAYPRGNAWTARFVPYINSTIVARLLDEWVGPDNWQDDYADVQMGGRTVTVCRLSIWSPAHGDWITKTDVGVAPSGTEDMSVKGLVSDAFKRAGILKWGCGRNVYTLPSLYAPVIVRARDASNPSEQELKKARPAPNYLDVLLKQLRDMGFEVTDVKGEHAPDDVQTDVQQTGQAPPKESAESAPATVPGDVPPPAPVTHPDDREDANLELDRQINQLKIDLIELVGDAKHAAMLWKKHEPAGGPQSEGSAKATYQACLRTFRNDQAPFDESGNESPAETQETLI